MHTLVSVGQPKIGARRATVAMTITALIIAAACFSQALSLAGDDEHVEGRRLMSTDIDAIIRRITQFSEAPNVRFRIVARLPESCSQQSCNTERDAAVQRLQHDLDALRLQWPLIARMVAERRIFLAARAGESDSIAQRVQMELLSGPLPVNASCPMRLHVLDESLPVVGRGSGLPLAAGSQVALRAGSRIEVKVADGQKAGALIIETDATGSLAGSRQLGAEGLQFEMPTAEVRLRFSAGSSASNGQGIEPRALGDVIIGMQSSRADTQACEWKLTPDNR